MEETKAKKESVPARVPARVHLLLLLLIISIDKSSAKRAYEEDVDENQELQGCGYSQNATLTCPSHHHFDVNRVMGSRYLPVEDISHVGVKSHDINFTWNFSPCWAEIILATRTQVSLSRADPSKADGYTHVSKSWLKLEQHVQRNMPPMAIDNLSKFKSQLIGSLKIKEVVLLVAALIVAASAYLLKGVYSSI